MKQQTVIDHFEIPEELAKRLSDVMTMVSIRMQMLERKTGDEYDEFEKQLMKPMAEFESIKIKITREYIPDKYRSSSKYIWNYNGWETSKNLVEIIEEK